MNIDDNSVKIAKNCNNPGNFADSDLIVKYINKVFGPGSAETDHEGCSAASGAGGNQGHIWFKDKNIGLFAYVKFLTFRMLVVPNPAEPELGQGSPFAEAQTLNSMLSNIAIIFIFLRKILVEPKINNSVIWKSVRSIPA